MNPGYEPASLNEQLSWIHSLSHAVVTKKCNYRTIVFFKTLQSEHVNIINDANDLTKPLQAHCSTFSSMKKELVIGPQLKPPAPVGRSPYLLIPPMVRGAGNVSKRPNTAGGRKGDRGVGQLSQDKMRIDQLEAQVEQLIKSKWSMEEVHTCVVRRLNEEIESLGGRILSGSTSTVARNSQSEKNTQSENNR